MSACRSSNAGALANYGSLTVASDRNDRLRPPWSAAAVGTPRSGSVGAAVATSLLGSWGHSNAADTPAMTTNAATAHGNTETPRRSGGSMSATPGAVAAATPVFTDG